MEARQFKDFLKNLQLFLKGKKQVDINIHQSKASLSLFSANTVIDFTNVIGPDINISFLLDNKLFSDLKALAAKKPITISVSANGTCLFMMDKTTVYAPKGSGAGLSFLSDLEQLAQWELVASQTLTDEMHGIIKLGKGHDFTEILIHNRQIVGFKFEGALISLTAEECPDEPDVSVRSTSPLMFPSTTEYVVEIYHQSPKYVALWKFDYHNCHYFCMEHLEISPRNFRLF